MVTQEQWLGPDETIIEKFERVVGGDPNDVGNLKFQLKPHILPFARVKESQNQRGAEFLNLYITNKRVYSETRHKEYAIWDDTPSKNYPYLSIPFSKIKEILVRKVGLIKMPVIIYEQGGELNEFCFTRRRQPSDYGSDKQNDLEKCISTLLEQIKNRDIKIDPAVKELTSFNEVQKTIFKGAGILMLLFFLIFCIAIIFFVFIIFISFLL